MMSLFPGYDRAFITLAVMRAIRELGDNPTLEQVQERVGKIIEEFGGGSYVSISD